jgi:hypothetical protein
MGCIQKQAGNNTPSVFADQHQPDVPAPYDDDRRKMPGVLRLFYRRPRTLIDRHLKASDKKVEPAGVYPLKLQ